MVLPYLKGLLYSWCILCVIVSGFIIQGFYNFCRLRTLQVDLELFPEKSRQFFFGVCRKFKENYWATTFPVSSENFGVKYI